MALCFVGGAKSSNSNSASFAGPRRSARNRTLTTRIACPCGKVRMSLGRTNWFDLVTTLPERRNFPLPSNFVAKLRLLKSPAPKPLIQPLRNFISHPDCSNRTFFKTANGELDFAFCPFLWRYLISVRFRLVNFLIDSYLFCA